MGTGMGIAPLLGCLFLVMAPSASPQGEDAQATSTPSATSSPAGAPEQARAPAQATPSTREDGASPQVPWGTSPRYRSSPVFLPAMIGGVLGVASGLATIAVSVVVGLVASAIMTVVFFKYMDWDEGVIDVETSKKDEQWCNLDAESCHRARLWKWSTNSIILSWLMAGLGLIAAGAGVGAILGGAVSPRE